MTGAGVVIIVGEYPQHRPPGPEPDPVRLHFAQETAFGSDGLAPGLTRRGHVDMPRELAGALKTAAQLVAPGIEWRGLELATTPIDPMLAKMLTRALTMFGGAK